MTSLALFPHLRRTLTDVMEDELYHVPGNISNANNSTSQQFPQQQEDLNSSQFQPQFNNQPFNNQSVTAPFLMQNHHLNNSNNSLNKFSSPTLPHTKLFRNPSALNSEEMLTIPDHQQQQQQQQQQQHHQQQHPHVSQLQHQHQQELSRIPSHDMYYDIPEPLPVDDDRHIFNEYADPNLTTTNHLYRNEQHYTSNTQHPQDHPQAPAKLLKFNDDLSLDYFTNEEDDSKFVIYPVMSPTMIPEEIEDEELSDDDDDDNEFTYLDNSLDDSKNPLNYQHQKFQMEQANMKQQQIQLIKQQEVEQQRLPSLQSNNQLNQQIKQKPQQDDLTPDIESDIDRMSLDSSDDEYSSNSSVLEDDTYTPNFKTTTSLSPPIPTPITKSSQRRSSSNSLPQPNVSTQSNQQLSTSPNQQQQNSHQCHLINPSTNQPCLKQFSRPYDLIRHQETIHASRKKIFRCVVCNKLEGGLSNKTFSRGDALSRHIRVKHGLTGNEATDALQYAKDHVEYV